METREDTVQFRRRKSVSGTIDRSAGNSPVLLILIGGQSARARPVRSGRLSGPGRVGVSRYRRLAGGLAPSPAPTPGVIPTTVHYPGETEDTPRSAELVRGFNRACTSPTANPERIAPMVAFAPMGRARGAGCSHPCSMGRSLMSVSHNVASRRCARSL